MNAAEVYAAMSDSVQRLNETMRLSRAEAHAMRRQFAVLRWLDANDAETPRWWQR